MTVKPTPAPSVPAQGVNQSTKKHLRGSSLLLAGRFISMGTNFAVQVMTVRFLTKGEYGAFAYAMTLVSLGSSVVVFGLDKAITRFLPIYQERGEYKKLFGSLLMVTGTIFLLSLLLVLMLIGFRDLVNDTFVKDPVAEKLLLILIFLSPIQALDSLLVGLLAIFAKPSAIFFRRHILGPGLKLLVVLLLILLKSDVYFLSAGYLASGALGVLIYSFLLIRNLRKQEMSKHFSFRTIQFPMREIFGFSIPLLTTNFVYLIRSQLVVVMLQYFRSAPDVASFRAVQPVSDLSTNIIQSFAILYMPIMARMYAKDDESGISDLYWQSAVWITAISFPIFLVTFSLAEPLTILLFGQRYAQSGLVMAMLSFGYFFNAALGFNADTLRVYGKMRYTVTIDFIAMLVSLGLNLLLIPRYGVLGAAIGTMSTMVIYNVLNHIGLKFSTKINLFQWRYFKVYASIALATVGLWIFQRLLSPHIIIGVTLAGILSIVVLVINRGVLNIDQTFPELLRFPPIRYLFSSTPIKDQEAP